MAFITQVGDIAAMTTALVAAAVLGAGGWAAREVLTATRTHVNEAFDIEYAEKLLPFVYHGKPIALYNLAEVMLRTLRDRRKANIARQADVKSALHASKLVSLLVAAELAAILVGFGFDAVVGL